MKLTATIISTLACVALMTSCGNKQQTPSQRVGIFDEDSTYTAGTSYVAYTPTPGGHAEVKVNLNDVPFKMLWDTGCTTTLISVHELKSMVKHGVISENDIEGVSRAIIADGSTVQNVQFNIETFEIPRTDGHCFTLHNVSVMVTANEDAGMLLGQNVIQELPRHKFDESKGLIQFDGE